MTTNRKKDFILISCILLFAVTLLGIQKTYGSSGDTVTITVNQEIYGTYSLDQDQTIRIENESGTNIVRIQNHEVWMEEADCPDGYCMEQGHISQSHQTLVCLPHKLVVEVTEGDSGQGSSQPPVADVIAK